MHQTAVDMALNTGQKNVPQSAKHVSHAMRSQGLHHQRGKQCESKNNKFFSRGKVEHEKHIRVMKSAETEPQEETWAESLRTNKKVVILKLGTGADCNSMLVKTLNTLDVRGRLRVRKNRLIAFFGPMMEPLGKNALECESRANSKTLSLK